LAKRIYEKARELGIESKELLSILRKLGFEPKTASSSFTEEMEKKLGQHLGDAEERPLTETPEGPSSDDTPPESAEDGSRKARRDAILKKIGKATGQPVSPRRTVEVETKPKKPAKTEVPKTVEVEVRPKKKRKKLKPLRVIENMTPADLAEIMDSDVRDILRACMSFGIMATANQRLGLDVIEAVAEEMGYFAILVDEKEFKEPEAPPKEEAEAVEEATEIELAEEITEKTKKKKTRKKKAKKEIGPEDEPRAPVVTIMGHVDHGKTTLLDNIRNSNIIAGEKGGITQHIGAYEVETKHGKITFIDTPGHEAFTEMRARGAQVTDIVVLVVSQEDSVMPQTIEAINHADAAEVPIIVAINKMDLVGANPDRVKNELAKHGIVTEDIGGEVLCAEISALKGEGVEHLLELISLQAEIMELAANPNGEAKGIVIEAMLDKFRGATATLLVQEGTLHRGDSIIAGVCPGRIRNMEDERGNKRKEAGPSTPVVVTGLNGVPKAGEIFAVVESDTVARQIAEERIALSKSEQVASKDMTLEDFFSLVEGESVKELPIVLKADVGGSAEAIKDIVENLGNEEVKVKLVHIGVGAITENDVLLAKASEGIVIGFNVKPDNRASKIAKNEKVDIKLYDVIYELEADVRAALEGMLEPEIVEEKIGVVEVRQLFKLPKVGTIVGCYVQDGAVRRGSKVEVLRAGEVIGQGTIQSLKRFKDDVSEVAAGFDCGIQVGGFANFVEGDTLIVSEVKEITRRLEG